ncbi:recombinase family protein [Gordonia amicalis]|uniref:Recombinase family protein n=1 Tax=Gordonia amicalis TaxID=89053 RepID=A0ABU4DFJ1_9ACTN|nr:recombinase family protein [Gordonia amicalis]MCZ4581201.1 recombinase family protein [Gordonia amicalis]MDV6308510.1 recombinase family protein [Gordonia amicalis]
MIKYGYIRVSTRDQIENNSLGIQEKSLMEQGVLPKDIFRDEGKSGKSKRDVLDDLLKITQPGDEIWVYSLDRFSRTLRDTLNWINELADKGVALMTVKERINSLGDDETSKITLHLWAMFAEMEHRRIKERMDAGRRVYLAEGGKLGRKRLEDSNDPNVFLDLWAVKRAEMKYGENAPVSDRARFAGCGRTTYYRRMERVRELDASGIDWKATAKRAEEAKKRGDRTFRG